MKYLLTSFLFLTIHISFGQQTGVVYRGFTPDNLSDNHSLIFLNDSIIAISKSTSGCLRLTHTKYFNYQKASTNIQLKHKREVLSKDTVPEKDTITLERRSIIIPKNIVVSYKDAFLDKLEEMTLLVEGQLLIDNTNSTVYILEKDSYKNKDIITFDINGKLYKDGSAILTNLNPEKIKRIEIHRGLKAYKKYGYDGIWGIVEIIMK
jgi:hypothetical protein